MVFVLPMNNNENNNKLFNWVVEIGIEINCILMICLLYLIIGMYCCKLSECP